MSSTSMAWNQKRCKMAVWITQRANAAKVPLIRKPGKTNSSEWQRARGNHRNLATFATGARMPQPKTSRDVATHVTGTADGGIFTD
jgi:hypothetical protein